MKQFKLLLLTFFLAAIAGKTFANNTAPYNNVLSFSGKIANNQQVDLTWTTGIMINEQGFDVESVDASGVWHKLGFVRSGATADGFTNFSFTDPRPVNGKNFYRLRHWEAEGNSFYSDVVMVELLKGNRGLSFQNYPNPFTATTLIRYEITTRGPVRLVVLDMSGMQLAQLVNKQDEVPGIYEAQWNGSNYPPGTYIYKIMTADATITQKMIKVK
jgi:hypothetical protein